MTRQALIVAHGQPSDPAGPEAEIAALAADVGALLPDWQIKGATLASPGALEAAIAGMNAPRIFPFFMSDGWFIRDNLPGRLEAAGHKGLHILTPFGLLAGAHKLALTMAINAAARAHWPQPETVLVLAAHGSGRSPHPAIAARETADVIGVHAAFRAIRVGFIEEEPHLTDVLARPWPLRPAAAAVRRALGPCDRRYPEGGRGILIQGPGAAAAWAGRAGAKTDRERDRGGGVAASARHLD